MRNLTHGAALALLLLAGFPLADAVRASFETGALGAVLYSIGAVPREAR